MGAAQFEAASTALKASELYSGNAPSVHPREIDILQTFNDRR